MSLPHLIDPLREGAITVVRTLRTAGFQALFAGGCVRDRVLGLDPKDYDIATDAVPEAVIGLFDKSIPVGVQFGVVRVVVSGHEYEVATFRAEADYTDGRRPNEVRWADARADVLRRDFTINGLLEDPLAPAGGEVLDFVGGRADLEARLIRAIGDPRERFLEDHLRLLRCVRFAARMHFDIDPATWNAVCELAPLITRVSPERIGDELDRIFTQGNQARGLTHLRATGLADKVLAEVAGVHHLDRAHARLAHLGACDPVIGWGVVLYDVAVTVEALALRLRWSRARTRDVALAIETAHDIARWASLDLASQKRAARRPTFGAALTIAGCAGHRDEERLARTTHTQWSPEDLRPPPLLTGEDLKRAGHAPGPRFKLALDALETAQLEGRATDLETAWQAVNAALD